MSTDRMQQLLAFLEQSPGDSFLTFAVAKEYENGKQWEDALAWYLKITEKDPDFVGVYYHLGKLYERLLQPELAISTYKTGMAAANKAGDRHAYSELAAAKMEIDEDE
ncbi:MAG: tetratricopeptide repeat protein [Saprospiraceae bacterium]|nr:tetratricopeptide repeat protein [Saprospiraceae bacterium]MDZ4704738.1 tetratricopeptide repeat protein [Saprospiraceae bacterium]